MLRIEIPLGVEEWDESKQEFIEPKTQTLQLEHSLLSLSKWESKWCKPFLSSNKNDEEILDYIKCMTVTPNVNPAIYNYLTPVNIQEITDYINAPMTAATFPKERRTKTNREIITADIIYYWMVTLQIPSEYQKWHLNRLLALIRVCNIKNTPAKKRSRNEIAADYAALNAARRKQYNSKG